MTNYTHCPYCQAQLSSQEIQLMQCDNCDNSWLENNENEPIEFETCATCLQPDACSDYGKCDAKVKRKNDYLS